MVLGNAPPEGVFVSPTGDDAEAERIVQMQMLISENESLKQQKAAIANSIDEMKVQYDAMAGKCDIMAMQNEQLVDEIRALNGRIANMDHNLAVLTSHMKITTSTPDQLVAKRRRRLHNTNGESAAGELPNKDNNDIGNDSSAIFMDTDHSTDFNFVLPMPPTTDSVSETINIIPKSAKSKLAFPPLPPVSRPLEKHTVKRIVVRKRAPAADSGSSVDNSSTGLASSSARSSIVDSSGSDSGASDAPTSTGWSTVTTRGQRKRDAPRAPAGEAKPPRVTPIQLQALSNEQLRVIGSELSSIVGNGRMFLQRFGDNGSARINCMDEEAKAIAVKYLQGKSIQFNSFNNAASRLSSFIIRGL